MQWSGIAPESEMKLTCFLTMVQDQHNELLADYQRQVRVGDIARSVQQEAAGGLATANRSAAQVRLGSRVKD